MEGEGQQEHDLIEAGGAKQRLLQAAAATCPQVLHCGHRQFTLPRSRRRWPERNSGGRKGGTLPSQERWGGGSKRFLAQCRQRRRPAHRHCTAGTAKFTLPRAARAGLWREEGGTRVSFASRVCLGLQAAAATCPQALHCRHRQFTLPRSRQNLYMHVGDIGAEQARAEEKQQRSSMQLAT
jgi:hypothetical protein